MALMERNIGNFTAMSRVILPLCETYGAGKVTGMDALEKIVERIEARLQVVNMSAAKASEAAGLSSSAIQNLRRGARGTIATKGANATTLTKLAQVLKTTPAFLMDGEEFDEPDMRSEDVAAGIDRAPGRTVKIKGYVGAGAEAHFYAVSDEDFVETPAPRGSTDQTIALEIRGRSWGPAMDSWLVYYDDVRSPVTTDMLGKPCVVGLSDDRILLKVIRSNGRGGYDLHPNTDKADEIVRDAEIEWAALVTGMGPR